MRKYGDDNTMGDVVRKVCVDVLEFVGRIDL